MFEISMCAILVASKDKHIVTVFANLGRVLYENASACLSLPRQSFHIIGLPSFDRLGPTEAIIKSASDSRKCMDRR